MKIAVIDTDSDNAPEAARDFLTRLLKILTDNGDEVQLFTKDQSNGEIALVTARRLNELGADVYLIWTAEEKGWQVLPLLDPQTATLAVAHADSERFYAPIRHYRSFLTRVVGTTPETCVGLVLSCVLDKERVEWIASDEAETAGEENLQKTIETYRTCFEKASADALAAPREPVADFPPLKTGSPESRSWFGKLLARFSK